MPRLGLWPPVALQLSFALLAATASPALAWDPAVMQSAARRLGPAAVAALPPLQALLARLEVADDRERLQVVNQFFNQRIAFVTDHVVWGQEDHWASPLEALAKGRGDCEDYAIAKYASLLAVGVAPARLRLVYVRARMPAGTVPASQAHMVLAYHANPGDEPVILDNLVSEVLPASARADLTPIFSFSSEGLWQGTGSVSAGDPLARVTRWREVWNKTRAEGFL